MNFYNPFLYSIPVEAPTTSLLSRFSFSSIINGASKTLNLMNQAIPVVKQMSPIMKNLKTMFNVMNEFKKADIENGALDVVNNTNIINESTEGPTFFV